MITALLLLNMHMKLIVVDLKNFSWTAIENTVEIKSGRAVGGRRRCPEDRSKLCRTPSGFFTIIKKFGKYKRSDLYPIECENKKKCGAKMPYYMKLRHDGVGIHGSDLLRGHFSHGCVRVNLEDAQWINKFVDVGTPVLIKEY